MDKYIPYVPLKTDLYNEKQSQLIPIRDTKRDLYDEKQELIPYIKTVDNYDETKVLIPIQKHPGDLTRKLRGLIKTKPWLASMKGILNLPPIISFLAPDLLLPPEFGMIAKQVQHMIADPTPINLAFTMLELPSMIWKRERGKKLWIATQELYKFVSSWTNIPIDRFIMPANQGENVPIDYGKDNSWLYEPINLTDIRDKNSNIKKIAFLENLKVDSFLGQQINAEFVPNNLVFITNQRKGNINKSYNQLKNDYLNRQKAFKNSVLEYIKNRNDQFAKSKYEKNNMQFNKSYFQQNNDPIKFVLRTSWPEKTITSSTFTFGRDSKRGNFVIPDPLSYQIESYKTPVFRNINSISQAQLKNNDFNGNLIKFWIKNLNDGSIMTTPAFISELQDTGLNGTWEEINYVNSYYPKFTYKGMEKRTITFTLKLACFDEEYFSQYIDKLNFLRTVGTPYYEIVSIPRTNQLEGNNIQTVVEPLKITLGKAPIYSLTLGDIVYEQPGFFQSCEFVWNDQQSVWNLDSRKMFGASNPIVSDNKTLIDEIKSNYLPHIEIPIVTTINCTFICLYGSGPSNNQSFLQKYNIYYQNDKPLPNTQIM